MDVVCLQTLTVHSQTVINDWAETQLIDPSSPMSASAVMDALRYSYSKDQEPVFDEIEPGTFV